MAPAINPACRPLWDDAPGLDLSPLAGDATADLCIVGLGGSGLTCVREAQRLGASVVGLDAGIVGGGAAGRNGGLLLAGLAPFYHDAVARYGREPARALYELTLAEVDRIAAETPGSVRRPGSLRIAESSDELADCAVQLAALRADGFPAEPYDGEQGRGLLVPGEGTFQPLARCRALARGAIADGARLHEQSEVVQIEPGVVRTRRGSVRATQVIVAIDGRLELLVPALSDRVRSVRLQMLATAPAPEVQMERPVYARWGYDYWHQRPDGSVAIGGGRDHTGDREYTSIALPTDEVQEFLEARVRTLGVTAPVTHRWAGIVGYTEDRLPVCEEVQAGVWAIGGYSGTGNVVGALLGRGVVRRALAGDDAIVRAFAAARGHRV